MSNAHFGFVAAFVLVEWMGETCEPMWPIVSHLHVENVHCVDKMVNEADLCHATCSHDDVQ